MPSGKPPITRHPLFPATVALWFGALFGIGSLAVGQSLIESAIVALKLNAVIAVPIGPTGRILIALALAGAGGLLGARLARRIGRPKPVARPRKRAATFGTRGTEDPATAFSADAAASPVVRGARRTQLAIPDDGHGEVEYYDNAPVPGAAQILDVSQFGIEGFEPETQQTADRDPAHALPAAEERPGEPAFLPGPAYDEAPEEPVAAAAPEPEEILTAAPVLPRLAGEEAIVATSLAPAEEAARPLFERAGPASLFAQPLNARVSEVRWQDGNAPEQPEVAPANPAAPDPATPTGDNSAAQRIASARLDDLAPIELLERLAISLREKRSRAALAASPLPTDPDIDAQAQSEESHPAAEMTIDHDAGPELDAEPESLEAEDLAIAPAAPPVPTIPAALRPVGLEPDDEEDDLPSFIPPRRIGGPGQAYSAPTAPAPSPDSGETSAAEPDLEGGYSSLLNLSRAASQAHNPAQRFVRIEEPEPLTDEIEPVVVFPAQMPGTPAATHDTGTNEAGSGDAIEKPEPDSTANGPDREETERALRSALANIQRMSGAA